MRDCTNATRLARFKWCRIRLRHHFHLMERSATRRTGEFVSLSVKNERRTRAAIATCGDFHMLGHGRSFIIIRLDKGSRSAACKGRDV